MTRSLGLLLIAITVISTSGCSPFRPTTRIDVAPFAESTINLVAEINYGLDAGSAVHLRKYINIPEAQEYRAEWEYFRPVLRGIGIYSLALVTLHRSNISDAQKAQQLADFLERLFKEALLSGNSRIGLTTEGIHAILDDVRKQDSLLDAIGAAQPMVDAVAQFAGEYLDVVKASQDRLEVALLRVIAEDYGPVIRFNDLARERQAADYLAASLLGDYRHGRNPDGIHELLEVHGELREQIPDPDSPTVEQLQRAEDRLLQRLDRIQQMKQQMAVDIETYEVLNHELFDATKAADNNLRRTRVTVFVWSSAHRRLGAGITDPAKINMMDIAKRAMNAAIP